MIVIKDIILFINRGNVKRLSVKVLNTCYSLCVKGSDHFVQILILLLSFVSHINYVLHNLQTTIKAGETKSNKAHDLFCIVATCVLPNV